MSGYLRPQIHSNVHINYCTRDNLQSIKCDAKIRRGPQSARRNESNLWQYSYLQFHIAKKKIQYIYGVAEVGSGSNNARSEWLSDNMKQSIFLKSIQYELSIYAWNASKNKNAS